MAFDVARGMTVLFGGEAGANAHLNDTWTWDGKNWTQLNPTTSPAPRDYHAMVYDVARQRTVLFGGRSGRSFLPDTWEWDGKNWTVTCHDLLDAHLTVFWIGSNSGRLFGLRRPPLQSL